MSFLKLTLFKLNFKNFSLENVKNVVKIALVGKYVTDNTEKVFEDAYASVIKALHHAALHCNQKLEIKVLFFNLLF